MKKFFRIILAIFTMIVCLVAVFGCDRWYEYTEIENENGTFTIGYKSKDAFIIDYKWTGDLDKTEVILPNDYNGIPITKLGGYTGRGFPCPFSIDLPSKFSNDSSTNEHPDKRPESYPNGYEVIDIKFTIVINAALEELFFGGEDMYCRFKHDDGAYTLYHPIFYYECPDDNKTFYTKDGVIYLKATDEKAEWTELG